MAKKKEVRFGSPATTPRGTLLDDEFLAKTDPDKDYGKDRYHIQIGHEPDADLSALKKSIEDLKAECIADEYFSEDDMLAMPFVTDSDWGPAKGKIVIKPRTAKRPMYLNWEKEHIDPDLIQAGMSVQVRVTPIAYNASATVKGITLNLKMIRADVNADFEPILSGAEDPDSVFAD